MTEIVVLDDLSTGRASICAACRPHPLHPRQRDEHRNVRRVVYAGSTAAYGDGPELPSHYAFRLHHVQSHPDDRHTAARVT